MHDLNPDDELVILRPYTVRTPGQADRFSVLLRVGELVRVVGFEGGPPWGLVRVALIERPEITETVLLPWRAVEGEPIWRLRIDV